MTTSPLPLILFSGLGADASIFAPQKARFPQLIVPPWTPPRPGDSLSQYCKRMASELPVTGPCVIGGASFGGIIALEMARFMHPLAVLLIGSVREPAHVPPHVRALRPLRGLTDWLPLTMFQWSAGPLGTRSGRRLAPHLGGLASQFGRADRAVLRWSMRQMLTWCEPPIVTCPVFRIHGDCDRVLPLREQPDTVVTGGGHVISLTHPEQVNQFIDECLQRVNSARGP
jgi:pimeloyl-ACP methyl ester carboxylesterase